MSGKLQPPPDEPGLSARRLPIRRRPLLLILVIAEVANGLTEALLYFLVIFTPWAFGTTQPWAIWVLNIGGYLMGALLLIKWLSRWWRHGANSHADRRVAPEQGSRFSSRVTAALATLTVLLLGYCLISALNARATYDFDQVQFHYHSCLRWLPHSYESQSTWSAFWQYLAVALVFWAVRDWLLDESPSEPGPDRPAPNENRAPRLPKRLRRLLWVLCLNGALLGLEGILQRMDGAGKLLWLVEPAIHKDAESQFGPYAYRSNAAQYFTLLWPVCLGFWWLLSRWPACARGGEGEPRARAYGVLLPCAMLMAACAIASLSRAGALIALGEMGVAWLIMLIATRKQNRRLLLAISALFLAVISLAGYLDLDGLRSRFGTTFHDQFLIGGRAEIYEHARRMAHDFALLGSGPKTFAPLYEFYFSKAGQYWATQVHNDWLETWITFGGVGLALIVLALLQVFCRYFGAGGIRSPWPFAGLIWLGLAGCLVYAVADFPFQVPSILFLFLLLSSISFTLSREGVQISP